jgi:hypothetical protein
MRILVVPIPFLLSASLYAQQQSPTAKPGWPCVAGRALDPAYLKTAEATGGQVFLFDRSEAARSMMLVGVADKYEDTIFAPRESCRREFASSLSRWIRRSRA